MDAPIRYTQSFLVVEQLGKFLIADWFYGIGLGDFVDINNMVGHFISFMFAHSSCDALEVVMSGHPRVMQGWPLRPDNVVVVESSQLRQCESLAHKFVGAHHGHRVDNALIRANLRCS